MKNIFTSLRARPRKRSLSLLVLVLGLSTIAACGGSELETIASETCASLETAIVLQTGAILTNALSDAEAAGYTGPELGEALTTECPAMMAAVDRIGDEQEAEANLVNEVDLALDQCTPDGASGTVTNNSDVMVDVFLDITFTADDGTLVDTGLGSVSSLAPGQTGEWDAYVGRDDFDKCKIADHEVYDKT
jgi:hypothetical protein